MANTGKIGIMCRVAATFRNHEGGRYTTVPLKIDKDAPAWITQTRLFGLLQKDGSFEVIGTPAKQKAVEQNPAGGATPDGKTKNKGKGKGADSGKDEPPQEIGGNPDDDNGTAGDEDKDDVE